VKRVESIRKHVSVWHLRRLFENEKRKEKNEKSLGDEPCTPGRYVLPISPPEHSRGKYE
jgi:hypothetical protein